MNPSPPSTDAALPLAALPLRGLAQAIVAVALLALLALYFAATLRGGARRRVGQRITAAGAVFSLLTLAAALVALHTKINFLVLVFGMLLSAFVLSFALSRAAMRKLSFQRVTPDGVHAGEPFTVELRATNRKRWLASYAVAVHDELPEGVEAARPGGVALELRPGQTVSLPYAARAARRGAYPLRAVTFSTRFPFGLFHQGRSRAVPGELVVYPRLGEVSAEFLGRLRDLSLSQQRSRGARGEEEFRNLREYRHGDNPRRIHWKTSAKLGTLLVREFEAVVGRRALIVLDTRARASGDEPLEKAVSFAASLARELARRGFAATLAAYAPDLLVLSAARSSGGLRQLFDALARLEPNPRRTLRELVDEPAVRAASRLVAVAALCRTDADAVAALDALRRRHPCVLAVDASDPAFADVLRMRHAGASAGE